MMRYGQVAALCASLLPLPSFAQGSLGAPDSQHAWTASASLWLGYNRSYREEVLGAYVFESLEQVRALTDEWLQTYNEERPHDSLGRVTPLTFLPRPNRPWSLVIECLLDGGAYEVPS